MVQAEVLFDYSVMVHSLVLIMEWQLHEKPVHHIFKSALESTGKQIQPTGNTYHKFRSRWIIFSHNENRVDSNIFQAELYKDKIY